MEDINNTAHYSICCSGTMLNGETLTHTVVFSGLFTSSASTWILSQINNTC